MEDESFDLGTSTFGLIFFPDPLVGLEELRRVMRRGGRVGIASWDMTRIGLPQLLEAALARAVPDLPAPAAPPWAHLCEPAGLGQALRAAAFTDVAVHQVTHHWRLPDPALFFRHLPDWTPPLRPLFTRLPPDAIDRAAGAFCDVVGQQSTSEGMPAVRRDRHSSAMMMKPPPGETRAIRCQPGDVTSRYGAPAARSTRV